MKFLKAIYKPLICKFKGHEYSTLVFRAGMKSAESDSTYDIEMKVCMRCGEYHMEQIDDDEIIDLDSSDAK